MGFQIGFPALRNYPLRYDPDVQAWINARAAASDSVPTLYAIAVNQYVLDLKAISGMWDAITQLLVFAGASTIAGAMVPIKGATPTASNFVDGDLALKTGLKGDTTSKSVNSGYTGTSFGQNNFHAYALVTDVPSNTNSIFGCAGSGTGAINMLYNNGTRGRTNNFDAHTVTGTGGWGLNRSVSGSYQRMLADSVATVTRASQATPARAILLFARSQAASDAAETWGDPRILVWALGAATTLANYTTPGDNLQTALNAI